MMADVSRAIPDLDRRGLRSFGLTTAGIVVGLFGVLLPVLLASGWIWWPWFLSSALAAAALVAPAALRPVYRGWMRFGLMMSRITTPLVLGVVFYLVITPVAIVMRLAGRDALRRRVSSNAGTYRVHSEKLDRERIERPF